MTLPAMARRDAALRRTEVRCRVESCGAWLTVTDPATDGKVKYVCAQCCADPGRYQQMYKRQRTVQAAWQWGARAASAGAGALSVMLALLVLRGSPGGGGGGGGGEVGMLTQQGSVTLSRAYGAMVCLAIGDRAI